MSTVYKINKGINKSIEFKGIKAQYIIYLASGMVGLLLLFAILYVIGVNSYICMGIVIPSAICLYIGVQRYSKKYGEHGLLNYSARKQLPHHIRVSSEKYFNNLSEVKNDEEKQKVRRRSSHI